MASIRSSSAAVPPGPVTSHRRIVSAPPEASPHNLAISAADKLLPIASPRSSRSCVSSGPVIAQSGNRNCVYGRLVSAFRGPRFPSEAESLGRLRTAEIDVDLDLHDASERSTCTKRRGERSARTITVNGVRQKYAGADNAKERGDCFQHDNNP